VDQLGSAHPSDKGNNVHQGKKEKLIGDKVIRDKQFNFFVLFINYHLNQRFSGTRRGDFSRITEQEKTLRLPLERQA
jgi:hypothetical protein